MKLLEWSLWVCSALVFAVSAPRAELPLDALQSTEGVAASLHASAVESAQAAGEARATTSGTGVRAPVGTPLPAVRVPPQTASPRISGLALRSAAADTEHIALGFLSERSLAPPRLG